MDKIGGGYCLYIYNIYNIYKIIYILLIYILLLYLLRDCKVPCARGLRDDTRDACTTTHNTQHAKMS
eukprot:COSAG06_NODE_8200_length_2217_cov_23.858477_2_plen_67_part_00